MIRKAVGAIRMPYVRIGGNVAFPPPFLALVQTDGSYRLKPQKQARVAFILLSADGRRSLRDVETIRADSSTEAEWSSIYYGLQAAIDAKETAIGIENDCLSVIHGLTLSAPAAPLRNPVNQEIRRKILDLAKQTTWTGVRWIPREENRADALF
jgi:ribonuclease HI